MFIYNGTLSDSAYGSKEMITIVFPAKFEILDPISAYWQWSNDPRLNTKTSVACAGHIHRVTKTSDGHCRFHSSLGRYSFEGTVSHDFKTLSLTMDHLAGSLLGEAFALTAMHINPGNIRSVIVYTGYLNWPPYACKETITLVVPYFVADGAFFGLYYQCTRDPTTFAAKNNAVINGVFQDVRVDSDGHITATYHDLFLTYLFTFEDNKAWLVLLNTIKDDRSEDTKFVVTYAL